MLSSSQRSGYDEFIAYLKAQRIWDSAILIRQVLQRSVPMTLSEKLAQIDRLKGWLDAFRPLPASVVAELKALYDVRFTYTSNAIEGNTLTQSETQLVLERGITVGGKSLTEHLEVVGHKEAIDYIEALARQETAIGEWEIRQIHSLILRKIAPEEAGCYRQLDVRAAGTEYVYPPHYAVSELMAEFVEWLGSEMVRTMHPVWRATVAHVKFVSIHPFREGNGRTGRLFMNLLLLRSGYPIVVISNRVRQAYIEALVAAQQASDLEPMLELVANAMEDALIDLLRGVATAGESRGRGLRFYREMMEILDQGMGSNP